MTILKYDDIIKNSSDLNYFFIDLMYYHPQAKFHGQGLTGSGFMTGDHFGPPGYLMSKSPGWLRLTISQLYKFHF